MPASLEWVFVAKGGERVPMPEYFSPLLLSPFSKEVAGGSASEVKDKGFEFVELAGGVGRSDARLPGLSGCAFVL